MSDTTEVIAERLRGLGSCALSDALDSLGLAQVLPHLRALTLPGAVVAGRALTVELGPADGTPTTSHLAAEAVDSAGADDVIVVANAGRTSCAGWGGLLSAAAARNRVTGVVVDGAVRDIDEARAVGLPVYGVQPTPVTARGRVVQVRWGAPVEVDGVAIRPGDWIVADGSGVVVVPHDRLDEVVVMAESVATVEARLAQEIAAGRSVVEVMNARYELMLSAGADT